MSETPLAKELQTLIAMEGPLPIDRFMALCLGHPVHGYYMTRDPFGAKGDFTTAPEVSQMFGEIVGVWCAACFDALGKPPAFDLVELGPGRGTLMSDLLRAAKVVPGFLESVCIHLIETSPTLRGIQERTLQIHDLPITWHSNIDELEARPVIFIANEFFDALPIRQFQRMGNRWAERTVGFQEGKMTVGLAPSVMDLPHWTTPVTSGQLVEISPAARNLGEAIGHRLAQQPGMLLVIDYGHVRSQPGETLQAVKCHGRVDILSEPGECDLTAHVDFEALSRALTAGGASVWAPLAQRDFLIAMGLELRVDTLAKRATTEERRDLDLAVDRLTSTEQMGQLFKVLAASSPTLSAPYPFHGRFQ